MNGVIEAASGLLERRLLAPFIPVLSFFAGIAVVVASCVGWSQTGAWWSALDGSIRLLLSFVTLMAALLLVQVLAGQRIALIRQYEGYWSSWLGRRLANLLRAHHVAIRDSLDSPIQHGYPYEEADVRPTRLGNILRSAEEHSAHRYSIDAVTTWPRLYIALPDTFRQTFAGAAADLDLAVVVSTLGAAFAIVGGGLAVLFLPWYGGMLSVACGCLVAWLGYRAAIQAAESYAALFRAAFDVHRWALLDEMGLRRPTGYRAEQAQWRALGRLWTLGGLNSADPAHLGYPSGDGAPAPPPLPDPVVPPGPGLPPPRRRRSAGAILAVVLFCAFASSAGALVSHSEKSSVPRAVRDLEPYHYIIGADVTGPGSADLVHRYTLRQIEAGTALASDSLGPPLAEGALTGRDVVTFKPPSTTIVAPSLPLGTWVKVRVAPRTTSTSDKAHTALPPDSYSAEALVLDAQGPTGAQGITLAVSHSQIDALHAAAYDGVLHVVVSAS